MAVNRSVLLIVGTLGKSASFKKDYRCLAPVVPGKLEDCIGLAPRLINRCPGRMGMAVGHDLCDGGLLACANLDTHMVGITASNSESH